MPAAKKRKIRGSVTGSVKKAKAGAATGSFLITYVRADSPMTVRFLTEPDGWFGYNEHYDQSLGYYPCLEDDCPGCKEGDRPSFRYLACALDRESDKVINLKLPRDLANRILMKYDKYDDTIMDRDYELTREGKGLGDTIYDVTPEAPSKVRVEKYEDQIYGEFESPGDRLEDIADQQWQLVFAEQVKDEDEEEDEDDEEETPRSRRAATKTRRSAPAKRARGSKPKPTRRAVRTSTRRRPRR